MSQGDLSEGPLTQLLRGSQRGGGPDAPCGDGLTVGQGQGQGPAGLTCPPSWLTLPAALPVLGALPKVKYW